MRQSLAVPELGIYLPKSLGEPFTFPLGMELSEGA